MHKTVPSAVQNDAGFETRTSELLRSLAPLNFGHFDGEKPEKGKTEWWKRTSCRKQAEVFAHTYPIRDLPNSDYCRVGPTT